MMEKHGCMKLPKNWPDYTSIMAGIIKWQSYEKLNSVAVLMICLPRIGLVVVWQFTMQVTGLLGSYARFM